MKTQRYINTRALGCLDAKRKRILMFRRGFRAHAFFMHAYFNRDKVNSPWPNWAGTPRSASTYTSWLSFRTPFSIPREEPLQFSN